MAPEFPASEEALRDPNDPAVSDLRHQLRTVTAVEKAPDQPPDSILREVHEQAFGDEEEPLAGLFWKPVEPVGVQNGRRDEAETTRLIEPAPPQGDDLRQIDVVPAHSAVVDAPPAIIQTAAEIDHNRARLFV